jgi:hypothetical protein
MDKYKKLSWKPQCGENQLRRCFIGFIGMTSYNRKYNFLTTKNQLIQQYDPAKMRLYDPTEYNMYDLLLGPSFAQKFDQQGP